jgi:alpha-1,6-mannosyltransferase
MKFSESSSCLQRHSTELRCIQRRCPPGGWIPVAGVVLLAAWLPLLRYPSLSGAGVVPFLCSFFVAGLAYIWILKRLEVETPAPGMIWGFAIAFRLVLLLTPVTLSTDVYRYIWNGHLLGHGINPYAQPVLSPLLDDYATPLRERVNYPWMATPYLPAAQVYFTIVNLLAPQSPFAFQLGATILDLAAGAMLMLTLRRLRIPDKAVMVYLWNPLVMVESAHGAHVDALMLFFLAVAIWGTVRHQQGGQTLSVLALAASVLVKGWPILAAPLFLHRWGIKRTLLFGISVALPLALFAASAGWGISGPADGRGVFGALRIYATSWKFNGGLYIWIEKAVGSPAARLISGVVPGLSGLLFGWLAWWMERVRRGFSTLPADQAVSDRRLLRWMALPFGLYLVLSSTIHPWYLTLVLALLAFFWPAEGENENSRRWIWPWVYFMFFEAFTYLAYSGAGAPRGLDRIQLIAYVPFWLLFVWAGLSKVQILLDQSRIS